jgi:hypothetical protein
MWTFELENWMEARGQLHSLTALTMEMRSSVSTVTTLQAGRPLSSGVLQLKLTANLKAAAQLSICEAVLPLLHMLLWHYTK